ncbi:MAG: hypothetical protein R8G66_23500 [Cytophagales bacterium]|nr:hypothetical protein [Cytophagales bacterium]
MTIDQEILWFYGWWQLIVCLFAFMGLLAIWWHLGKKQGDLGQVWLALSILCWSLSGATEVIFISFFQNPDHAPYLNGLRSVFSLSNSLFILLGLPWFRYLPERIAPVIKSKSWTIIVLIPFGFSILPTISRVFFSREIGLIYEPDIYYGIFTLFFLGGVLWESFQKRRLKWLAWLSLTCILTTLLAQLLKHPSFEINPALLSAIFKTFLIMIFFALALSWVKELSEHVIPAAKYLQLQLIEEKHPTGKMEHRVKFFGIPNTQAEFQLSPALFELLSKFIQAFHDGEGWLEIKPKSDERTNRSYDIQDHNQIKRLLVGMLDGLYGKGQWNKELHELPLRQTLFEMSEKRERKIRLAIPAKNAVIISN